MTTEKTITTKLLERACFYLVTTIAYAFSRCSLFDELTAGQECGLSYTRTHTYHYRGNVSISINIEQVSIGAILFFHMEEFQMHFSYQTSFCQTIICNSTFALYHWHLPRHKKHLEQSLCVHTHECTENFFPRQRSPSKKDVDIWLDFG